MSETPLKLLARDDEDMRVVAAILQDAILPVCDMLYQPEEKNFIMIAQRFCWDECGKGADDCFERVRCAINITGIEAVQTQGFSQTEPGRMLELLTIELQDEYMLFIFAGGGRLRLSLDKAGWRARIEDFGVSWPTMRQPCHAT